MDEYIVVLAGNADGRPRASAFAGEDVDAAVIAAHAQQFSVVVPHTEELIALAGEIPAGRVTAAGKVSCAFVKQETYDKFAALIGSEHEVVAASGDAVENAEAGAAAAQADPWSEIAAGSVVLATIGRDDGWWEAVVLATDPSGERLTLSWRDWPNMPSFSAARRAVALTAGQA